jgi:tetratricopeptide (TPR) repeat protein
MKFGKITIFLILFVAVLSGSCLTNEYEYANTNFHNENYKKAIKHYTNFIRYTPEESPMVARAKLERSECYFYLGKRYFEQEDYNTAQKLFYFANSDIGDEYLAQSYYYIAQHQVAQHQVEDALNYLGQIGKEHSNTEVADEAVCYSIKILTNYSKDYDKAWWNYKRLLAAYPNSDCIPGARRTVEKFCDMFIEKGARLEANGQYEAALHQYRELLNTKTKYEDLAREKAQDLFLNVGYQYFQKGVYDSAFVYYDNAEALGSTEARQYKLNLADKFYELGKAAYDNWDFEKAKPYLKKAQDVNPDMEGVAPLLAGIELRKERMAKADSLYQVADLRYATQRYKEAKQILREVLNLYPFQPGAKDLLAKTEREIKIIENAPQIAINIVKGNAKVIQGLKKQNLLNTLRWSSVLSPGAVNQFEVTAASENSFYIFRWLVNIKSQEFYPLNLEAKTLTESD